jgi:hypothetical protein
LLTHDPAIREIDMKRLIVCIALAFFATPAWSHCDWVKGPVVQSAREAIASGDVTPVLRWVQPADEQEIRDAFVRTLKVRTLSAEAGELADRWFFELVVRIHRRGEGETFEGLKGPDYKPEEGIGLADEALQSGTLDHAEKLLLSNLAAGLRERFAEVMAAKKDAGTSVEAGRAYVRKYADFVHYAERLSQAAAHGSAHADHHP